MKKELALFLALCMLFTVIPLNLSVSASESAIADDGIIMYIDNVPKIVSQGKTFTVDISLKNNSGINSWIADLYYNTNYFTVIECSLRDGYELNENYIHFLWTTSGIENYFDDGSIATITFKVSDDVPSGIYDFNLIFTDGVKFTSNSEIESVSVTTIPCQIEIGPIKVTSVEIDGLDAKTEYFVGDTLDINTLILKVTYNNGDIKYITDGFEINCDLSSANTKVATVTYEGFSDSFDVVVVTPYINLSDKEKTLVEGNTYKLTADLLPKDAIVTWESLTPDVASVDSNGNITAISAGTSIINATTTVNDISYSAQCEVTVEPLIATSIEIIHKPDKVIYTVNQDYDNSGLIIKVNYNDGTSKNLDSGYTMEGFDSSVTGQKTIIIRYEGLETCFIVNIINALYLDNSSNAYQDGTFTVDLMIADNPGFVFLNASVKYNKEYLTLVGIENKSEGLHMTSDNSIIFECDNDYTENGILATLTFKVSADAPLGELNIEVLFGEANNSTLNSLGMAGLAEQITIIHPMYGDVNGDNKVSAADLVLIRRHLASKDLETGIVDIEVKKGADTNGDGKVNGIDLTLLRQYLANLDPYTGESTIILGPQ